MIQDRRARCAQIPDRASAAGPPNGNIRSPTAPARPQLNNEFDYATATTLCLALEACLCHMSSLDTRNRDNERHRYQSGLKKPANDLSRGARVTDIVYTIAITAIQAQEEIR